jgi:hypothetical protein
MTSDMTSEEQPVKMTGQEDNAVRMAGYLDKRGKMVSCTTCNFLMNRPVFSFLVKRMTTLSDREST